MSDLQKGAAAPPFALENQHGEMIKLDQFAGRKVLIYFYPKANTPGCTTQACAVRDALAELRDMGVEALGISPDKPPAQNRFDQKFSLGFPLLCDTEHSVAEAYGVWREKKMYGKSYMGILRSAFLIDETGNLSESWYKVSPGDTVPNVLKALA
jgi:peroxiredoxin Q/BCP